MGDASAYAAPSTSMSSDAYTHLPKLQQAIIRFMAEQPPSSEGIHVFAIARAVGGGATDAQKISCATYSTKVCAHPYNVLSAALDSLMDEGLVYTTSDDSHFTLAT